ncbi:hypothetical protein [Noviherbaspirillum aerium]|uniref:hypothetical protein n=1 Tax=Noviherbaspirillum aerium TaxID=2588497 RepID=UPI00178C249E|nr:hypothetical protein [Noviherbaspirillum aerium]
MNSANISATSAFARLMEKLTGKPAAPEQAKDAVEGADFGSKSIVDVTEALLRQLDK